MTEKLKCNECGKEWSRSVCGPGERCGVRIDGKYWCRGILKIQRDAATEKHAVIPPRESGEK